MRLPESRLGDPDDDVVGEAHPKALLARLDAACRGTASTIVQRAFAGKAVLHLA